MPTNQTTNYTRNNWSHLIKQLRNASLSIQEALHPCIQVAMYEATKHNFGEFQEMVSVDVPTCGVVWCGFNASLTRSGISPWSCMPIGCRSGITVIIVICILFAIFITMGNILILAVIWRTPALHHSQSVYKFSIALSDFLIGAIVFPASANSILMLV
uniref:G-protein coupled receptors family 1 profile domain-containing protein n=2 Tax=Ciona intestinalis TaxID=7719 RepID=H2XNQ5_CIOIN